MKYTMTGIAALLVAGLAVPAGAQDLGGFRIEARAGWDRTGGGFSIPNPDYDEDDDDSPEFLEGSRNDNSITYGGEVGYDYQFRGGPVIGIYAGADFSDGAQCLELVEDDLACSSLGRTFTVGARAGMALGRSSLIYVKGGYSNGKMGAFYDPDLTDNDENQPGPVYEFSKTKGGYHVGGGVQVGLTENLYAKLEYVYTDYGSRSDTIGTGTGAPTLVTDLNRHQVLAGVGVRF